MQKDRNWLKSVEIKSSFPLTHVKAEFVPGLNIIIGPNGSGKSTFVKETYEGLKDDNRSTSSLLEFVIEGKAPVKLTQSVSQSPLPVSRAGRLMVGGNRLSRKVIAEFPKLKKTETKKIWSEVFPGIHDLHNMLIGFGLPDGGAQQLPLLYSKSFSLKNFHGFLFVELPDSIKLTNFEHEAIYVLDTISVISDTELEKKSIHAAINLWQLYFKALGDELDKYTPIKAIRLAENYRIDVLEDQALLSGLLIEFQVKNHWVPFELLSDGTKRMFDIISSVISAKEVAGELFYKNDIDLPNTTPNFIFLEEPELGIHPHQLHKLMLFLREQAETKQIIITTHSPQVLDYLEKDQLDHILLCSMDAKKGTQLRHLTKKEIARANKYLTEISIGDYWRHANLEENAD